MQMTAHSKVFNATTIGILTTIFSGLIIFLFQFFAQTFPNTQARIQMLEQKSRTHDKTLERIDSRTQKIYEILIEKN